MIVENGLARPFVRLGPKWLLKCLKDSIMRRDDDGEFSERAFCQDG